MLLEDRLAEGIYLALQGEIKTASLEAQVKTTDPGEEGRHGRTPRRRAVL